MTKRFRFRLFAVLFIICLMLAGMYKTVVHPKTLSVRAVMVCGGKIVK